MSCRVLGRQVEQATLNLVAATAAGMGAERLRGFYVPSAKNAMVKEHYAKLGFAPVSSDETGASVAELALGGFAPPATFIALVNE